MCMKKLPEYIIVQIDDVDKDDIYYSATEREDDMSFTPSNNHPAGVYKLIKNL